MSEHRPGEPAADEVSYEPWPTGLQPGSSPESASASAADVPSRDAAAIRPDDLQLEEGPPRPYRRRVRLPLILFALTAFTTWLTGATNFFPIHYLLLGLAEGSLMPLRRVIVSHWDEGLIYMLCVMSILLAHEMGHFVFTLIYGVRASLPFFLPFPIAISGTAGAVIAMDGRKANRPQIFDIGIAGPLAGLALIVPITWVGIQRLDFSLPQSGGWAMYTPLAVQWAIEAIHPGKLPESGLIFFTQANGYFIAGWFGLIMTALNMFPVGQLDGGHITYTLWGRGAHWFARALMIFVFAYMVFSGDPTPILMAVLVMVMGTDHPPTADDRAPLGGVRLMLGYASLMIPLVCFPPKIIELYP